MYIKMLILAVIAFACVGCASSLKTFDANGQPTAGVPVASPALVKISTKTTYEVAPGGAQYAAYCTEEINADYKFLPLGERSYITFKPSEFGKGEFKLEFNDAGGLKTVSLNSDAAAGAEQITGLISSVLPFLSAPKVGDSKAASDPAQKIKEQYCIKKGTEVISVERVKVQ